MPPPSGSPLGSHAYPSLRPSMGRGTRPPRSKAEVMLSSWSSAGSQRPPKAVRKRLAGVEGSTSSTSWLRTRNSAWYGSRGPGRARLAPQAAPSPAQILPKPPHPSPSLHLLRLLPSSFTPHTSQAPNTLPQPHRLRPAEPPRIQPPRLPRKPCSPLLSKSFLPHTPSQERSPKTGVGGGAAGAGGTFWVPDQEH